MKYTVLWVPKAEQELARIWMEAKDRKAVTTAAHSIEFELRHDPNSKGESREFDRRILLVPPLGVLFKVRPEDRFIHVLSIWRFEI